MKHPMLTAIFIDRMCSIYLYSYRAKKKIQCSEIINIKHSISMFGCFPKKNNTHKNMRVKKKQNSIFPYHCYTFAFHALHAIIEHGFLSLSRSLVLSIDLCYFKCYSWLIVQYDSLVWSLCWKTRIPFVHSSVSILIFNQRWYVSLLTLYGTI